MRNFTLTVAAFLIIVAAAHAQAVAPTITGISLNQGPALVGLKISGTNFGPQGAGSTVTLTISGVARQTTIWSS